MVALRSYLLKLNHCIDTSTPTSLPLTTVQIKDIQKKPYIYIIFKENMLCLCNDPRLSPHYFSLRPSPQTVLLPHVFLHAGIYDKRKI